MKHLTAILLWLIGCHGLSQPVKERVILFPDRNLYISGELIQFSAFIRSQNDSFAGSRILYCELVTSDGRSMASGKYATVNSTVSGSLVIPPELISGIYYLKAYTKAMRNEGPSVYSYEYIKVVNPYRSEVNSSIADQPVTAPVKSGDTIPEAIISNMVRVPAFALPGDSARIFIDDSSLCKTLRNLTISVIPEHTLSDRIISPADDTAIHDNAYLPETKGILITGIVKNRSNGNVIPGIRVNLSITGEGRDFMSASTAKDGRFVFSVPDYKGNRDIFLCTESTDSLDAQILVDNDFCNLPVSLPEADFELSDAERQIALTMANRFSMETYFNNDSVEGSKPEETPAFYGKPDEILAMDEYVQLPTLEDYFNQLPVSVKVRKRSGHNYFKVLGTQAELMDIDPLVMVDLVVIDDPEKILALDPRDITRIDIVNAVYVKGDRIYGGIVNVISREGDFAGISLPSSGVFINYSFISSTVKTPVNSVKTNVPDTRNTVFWKVFRDQDNCTDLSFIAPATPGKYLVVIRGVDGNGEEVGQALSFTVKGQ
ncbi:MAG: hypothetical protein ACM3UT_07265 [Chloroflexota bacterium]